MVEEIEDYAEKLLNEVHEKLKKQKEEGLKILKDMEADLTIIK